MPEPSLEPLLSVRDLRVSFRSAQGRVRAVDGVSFELSAGEILGVVGESGSGKSVTLMSLLGLIDNPNVEIEGSVRFRGRELIGLSAGELQSVRGREIAYVFQDPMTALTPVWRVGWQIVEQLRAHTDLSQAAARARAIELLAAVGMPSPAQQFERYPHELSGGMRQRAVIAMALSCNPAVLIADEPTTALDVTVQAQILGLIHRLREQFGSAVLLVTHDMGVVAETADRVMVMYAGRVVEQGSAAELFDTPWHPYTWGLLGSIPPLDGPRPRRLPAIAGLPPALSALPPGCAFAPRCAAAHAACTQQRPLLQAGAPGPLAPRAHAAACLLPADERAPARERCTSSLDA
ncbi:ABC transporter ATP-binding protein [Ideonella azotifigens]|uniref:ABC transporter ATP-binding protein n=2 Tax=Ideonella azotifigens TaxID=513160 RepID=A0ABP3VUT2_9BURK|nr:ABC transporter ATP-binding protein [Ideonella azotifigens]MCD2339404.1 ABC transporter ATP-binding protein [Ideonella azotifigens]